jgi:hypothetical protein
MAKTSKPASRKRLRRDPAGPRRPIQVPPDLASPLVLTAFDQKVREAAHKVMKNPAGSPGSVTAGGVLRGLEVRHIKSVFDLNRKIQIGWPPTLYIPSNADHKAHWPHVPPPEENRYARDWTSSPIGLANASRANGSLFAWAATPTVKGAIDGKAEAGLGILFTPTHTLSRVRIEPELIFTGRYEWSVSPPPVVRVTTLAIGSLFVGGFRLNPVTGAFESLATIGAGASPWRRHEVFNRFTNGHGASMMETLPFSLAGKQAAGEVLVEGGRTYLLSVVAQVTLRVETTRSDGTPINVTQGTFNTWGSLTGIVREIWLGETTLIA